MFRSLLLALAVLAIPSLACVSADEVDVLGLASQLPTKPNGLDKSLGETGNKTERGHIVGTWKGYSIQGDDKTSITVQFQNDGTVTNTGSNGLSGRGKWKIEEDSVRITWSTGTTVTFQVKGKQITGSGKTSRGLPWSVRIEKE